MPLTLDEIRKPGKEIELLKLIRTIALASYMDDREVKELQKSMYEILVLTKQLGNDKDFEFDWQSLKDITKDHP